MGTFEENCLKKYKAIKAETVKKIIPIIDFYRKIQGKPAIPLKEKMCDIKFPSLGEKVIMLHGVSVGEVISLEKLIIKIRENFPEYKIVLTTGTVTGQELAKKKYAKLVDFVTYFPLDVYECCKKFLVRIMPSIVLIAETEIWPNFVFACKERGIPLYIINGRISDKSYKTYLMFKKLLRPVFKCYTGVFCQSELDKTRFIELGSNMKNTHVMRNLKFDIDKQECDIVLGPSENKIFIAASTHPGEEELALSAYRYLKGKILDLKLLIAPRHTTRIPEIKKMLKDQRLKFGLRSKKESFAQHNILILDTIGELSRVYALCHAAFIGGSFSKTGGHNPIEAAIYGKPTVSGPSVKNFRDIYGFLQQAEASFVAKDTKEFYQVLEKLFCSDSYYRKIARNCERCVNAQAGATDFVIHQMKAILKVDD